MNLKGAVAPVTGGNGGLGQRICHALAKEGAHIAVAYAQSREQAERVAGELASRYQTNAVAFACDITDAAAIDRLLATLPGGSGAWISSSMKPPTTSRSRSPISTASRSRCGTGSWR